MEVKYHLQGCHRHLPVNIRSAPVTGPGEEVLLVTMLICHNRDIIAAQVSRSRHNPARATWPGHVSCPALLRPTDQTLRSAGNGMCLTTGSRTAPRPACGLWTGDPSSGVICIVHGHCSNNHGTGYVSLFTNKSFKRKVLQTVDRCIWT